MDSFAFAEFLKEIEALAGDIRNLPELSLQEAEMKSATRVWRFDTSRALADLTHVATVCIMRCGAPDLDEASRHALRSTLDARSLPVQSLVDDGTTPPGIAELAQRALNLVAQIKVGYEAAA